MPQPRSGLPSERSLSAIVESPIRWMVNSGSPAFESAAALKTRAAAKRIFFIIMLLCCCLTKPFEETLGPSAGYVKVCGAFGNQEGRKRVDDER